MLNIFETIATTDFAVFLLGLLGLPFFEKIQQRIIQCNPKVFSTICVVLTYIVISLFVF